MRTALSSSPSVAKIHPTTSSRCLGFYRPRRHLSLLEGSLFALASTSLGRDRDGAFVRDDSAGRAVVSSVSGRRRRGARGMRRGGDWGASAPPRPRQRRQWSDGAARRRPPPRAAGAKEEAEDPRGVVKPRSSVGIFKTQIKMYGFSPHGAPGHAGAAIDVAREVLEDNC